VSQIRPLGPNHALLCGMVAGALMRVADEHFQVEMEVDGADFTGRTLVARITRPSGLWAVEIVPLEVSEL
jgi:hypothetical protein